MDDNDRPRLIVHVDFVGYTILFLLLEANVRIVAV